MGTLSGADLAIKMYMHTQELNVGLEYETAEKIENIDGGKKIICESGNVYEAKSVILAVGTKPRMLQIPNELDFVGDGISWCAICDGARYHSKRVIVIGGGNSAVEEATYLADIAEEVIVITLFNLTADPIACDKLRSRKNVTIYEYYDILEFLPGSKFTGIKAKSTQTGEEIEVIADGAFEYIGLEPMSKSFEALGILDAQGYVRANTDMETSQEGIFAAGDVTVKHLRQVITACGDGAIAAQSAAKYVKNLN